MGCIKFESALHESSIGPSVKLVITKFRKQNPTPVVDFTRAVVDRIKATNLFELDSEEEILSLSQTLGKLIKDNKMLSSEQKGDILKGYENVLFEMFNIDPETSTSSETETDLILENQPEDIDNESVNSEQRVLDYNIDRIYGKAVRVKEYMLNQFRSGIVNASLVNFKERKRIKTTRDLNLYIAKYKNELFKKIFDYVKKEKELEGVTIDSSLLDYIYNDNGIPDVANMDKVMALADGLLYNLDRSTLSSAYLSKSIQPGNRQLVDAFNAYVILSKGNFDNILSRLMGKDFVIKKIYKGETDIKNEKYKFQSANAYRKSWKNSENIDAISEIGSVPKLLIEQTPLVNHLTGIAKEDENLTLKQFLYTMNKLVDVEYIRRFPNELREIAVKMHTAPNYYLKKMLDIIMSPNFNAIHRVFSASDMNVLRSIYDRFYNSGRPDSLYSIMMDDYQNSMVALTYDLLEVVSGVVDRTNPSRYVQYNVNRELDDMQSTEIMQSNSLRKRLQRENDMEVSNKLRTDRKELIENFNIRIANQATGDISFDIAVGRDTYTFTFIKDGKVGQKLRVALNGTSVSLGNIIQEPSFSDLRDYFEKEPSPETAMNMSKKEVQVYTGLVDFVDRLLNTGFLKGNSDLLEAYKDVYEVDNLNYLTDNLMYMAADAALINYVYNEYESQDEYDDLEEFARTYKFYNDIPDTATWKKYYDSKSESLKVININLDPLDKLASAEQMVSGEMYKTVTKNAEGNNIPTNRISNLANQTRYYLQTRILDNPMSTIKDNIFAGNVQNLFGVNIKTDAVSRNGVRKSAPNFTEAEHGYASIMLDFYGYLVGDEDPRYKIVGQKAGSARFIQVQPTVYSDKNTFYMWRVGTKYNIVGQDGKTYTLDLGAGKTTSEDLNRAIKDTIGNQYKKTYERVFQDYRRVLSDRSLALSDPNSEFIHSLKEYAEKNSAAELLRMYESIVKKQSQLAKINEGIAKQNENITKLNAQHVEEMAEAQAVGDFMTFYEMEELLPMKSLADLLTDQEVIALLSVMPISTYNTISIANGIRNIENLHVNKGAKVNGETCVKPNHLLLYNVTKLYSDDKIYDSQMLREKKRFVRDLIQFNLSFPLVYSDGKVNKVLQSAIKKFGGSKFEIDWVNQQTKELIIAKQNGTPITRLNPLTDIRDGKEIELNPLLERYFLSDFLMSENLRILTTGFELAHPNKSSAGDALTMENAELEEASRAGGQYKRNVIITATKQCMQQGGLMGIPPTMRIAVMPDVSAKVYNINGISGKVDAHDGSAFNNPIWSVLENLALQDAAVGEDKKPIGHGFTSYGTAQLLKFATFSQYNERLRKSQLSPIDMYDKFRSMNFDTWESVNDGIPVDLTKNIFGKQFTLRDLLDGGRLFFRSGNKHYEILSLDATGNTNEYVRTIQEVDINGNVIKGTRITEAPIIINTNFALHSAMGGVYSESLVGDTLSYGDASIYVTAAYANNVGQYDFSSGEYPSQLNTRQPLKRAMIAYMVNKSAMKVGVENINFDSIWDKATEEELEQFGAKPLNTMEMATDGLGMQMDADHIVTDPEHQSTMTEFSQVISALEANGTVHDISKQAYRDLGKVALAAIADVDEAIREFMNSDFSPEGKSKIYEIVARHIVKELKKDGKNLGMSQGIVTKVNEELAKRRKNHIEDEFKIPFSDPSIFSKALAGFTSAINSTAIKRKFPGMGAVMAPAYNIMMNFNINGLDMSYDDIYRMAAEQGQTPREYLDEMQKRIETEKNADGTFKHLGTIDKVLPNDIVRVADEQGNIILDENEDPLEFNIQDYATYNMVKSAYTHFFPVVSKPKNLKPMDVHWRLPDGRQFNLYDLPQVKYAFSERPKYKKGNPIPKALDLQIQKGINDALALLEAGYMTVAETGENTITMAMNGTDYLVTLIAPGSLVNNPAEVILSKIYAERFNLGPQDTLNDVMSQGDQFFIKKHELYHKPKTSNYDVCLTKGNGKHTYIVFQNSGVMKNLSANKDESAENYVRDGDNLYRVDEDGNKMYRAGAYDEAGNLTMLIESYSTSDADSVEEVLVVKNIETVLELYNPKIYDGIVLNRNAEPIEDTIYELIAKGAEEGQGDFVDMQRHLGEGIKYRDFVQKLKVLEKDRIAKLAKKKFVSFQKSLEYTVARIPAQTLQSFMKMKAVQFSDSDKNVVYVTHWQTWLQGSDY